MSAKVIKSYKNGRPKVAQDRDNACKVEVVKAAQQKRCYNAMCQHPNRGVIHPGDDHAHFFDHLKRPKMVNNMQVYDPEPYHFACLPVRAAGCLEVLMERGEVIRLDKYSVIVCDVICYSMTADQEKRIRALTHEQRVNFAKIMGAKQDEQRAEAQRRSRGESEAELRAEYTRLKNEYQAEVDKRNRQALPNRISIN